MSSSCACVKWMSECNSSRDRDKIFRLDTIATAEIEARLCTFGYHKLVALHSSAAAARAAAAAAMCRT